MQCESSCNMLLEDQGSGLSFLPVVVRKDSVPLCPYYVSLSLPCLCCLRRLRYEQHIHSVALDWYSISAVILTCITLSFPGMYSNAASLKTIGSSDTSKTTKTSFSIFSRRFSCCLYSLWFNIQQSTTCTRKHTEMLRTVVHTHRN